MDQTERKILEQNGWKESRSFYHTWSKTSDFFTIFQPEKRRGYFNLEIICHKEEGYEMFCSLQIELEYTENSSDVVVANLFHIRNLELLPLLEEAQSTLEKISEGIQSSIGNLKIR